MLIRLLGPPIAILAVGGTAYALVPQPSATPLQLPDLVQERPSKLVVTRAGREYRLGFRSAVRNVGPGPLEIVGARQDRSVDEMTADQVLKHASGRSTVKHRVGALRYVVSPDHRHWHLLGFQRYTLERRDGTTVVRDGKTGFCLGDRYAFTEQPSARQYPGRCGLGQPARLGITQGIAPGYGDAYAANLEGQYLRLNGVPAGTYRLVHRVNAGRPLRERRYDNNAAAVTLRLRWVRGVPQIKLVG